MNIQIQKPELQQRVLEEIQRGHFADVDELLTKALDALGEKEQPPTPRNPRKNLAQFLLESPFAGSDLDLERHHDYGRSLEL